jgi:ATP adenylyltransferase
VRYHRRRIIDENPLAYAIRDGYPVTPLHTLIIPKRHAPSYFELGRAEVNACNLLLERVREVIRANDRAVEGFNVGLNDGEVAGQSVFHCHIHLIPRRGGTWRSPREE